MYSKLEYYTSGILGKVYLTRMGCYAMLCYAMLGSCFFVVHTALRAPVRAHMCDVLLWPTLCYYSSHNRFHAITTTHACDG